MSGYVMQNFRLKKKNIATIEAKSVEGVYLVRILTTSGYLLT